jgi:uncharacterized protein
MSFTDNKFALITGASSGIGYELARIFAAHEYNLIIVARTYSELEKVALELIQLYGVRVLPIACDLSGRAAPFELYAEIEGRDLQVEVLVNDAAQGVYGKFADTDIEKELDILQLNVGAYLVLTKLFLREMLARGSGKILNVASIAGKFPGPYQSVYHGTKAFIHSFTEAVRAEIEGSGVTITSLLPGATATDFFRKANMEESKILNMPLSDPAEVARDGFNALMAGDDMVISGFRNKAQVAASNLTPDHLLARGVMRQQEPRNQA